MQIITNNKVGQKLLHQGYMYTPQHDRPSGKRWQCVQRNEGCKGAVKTTGIAGDPVVMNLHNHEACEEKVAVVRARATMKRTAESGIGKPAEIFNRVQATLPEDARMIMPSTESCKRSLRRSLTINEPAQPDDLQVKVYIFLIPGYTLLMFKDQ
jgi:hypothetical protein